MNGVSQIDIDAISPDNITEYQIGDRAKLEVSENDNDGKCISILKLWKDEKGYVHWCRSTKSVIYEPDDDKNAKSKRYPIAHLRWSDEKGSARGAGEIYRRIPNQIEINKTIARTCISVKQTAYPHIVYNENAIDEEQIAKLTTVGATIPISSQTVQDIKDAIGYMETTQIQPVVMTLLENLITQTRELAGAGEIATGNINPEKASGAAIIAQRDSNAKPLNIQVANFKQFIEDIALVWIDMDIAYNPNGITTVVDGEQSIMDEMGMQTDSIPIKKEEVIPIKEVEKLKLQVKIDVSPTDPYTKYSENTTLENLLAAKLIEINEFEEVSDVNSPVPKQKLKQILDKRLEMGMASPSEIAKLQQELMIAQTTLQIAQIKQQLEMLSGNVVPAQQVQLMEEEHRTQLKEIAKK